MCQGMHAYNDSRRQSSLQVDNRDHLAEMEGAKAYHEVLTIHFKCSLCGSKGCITFEYNADDEGESEMGRNIGKYESYESIGAQKSINMSMRDVCEVFNTMIDKSPKNYSLMTYNCKTFAKQMYQSLR